jgi:hypothetical protein
MHSHYRGLEKNQFCPLDLYSQDKNRRKKALNALLYDSPLEKTLKMLLDGDRIALNNKDAESKCSQALFGCNTNGLLRNILNGVLESDPILQKLKQLQMHLDELGASEINSYYKHHHDKVVQYDIEVWKNVVNKYHDRLGLFEKGKYSMIQTETEQMINVRD